MELCFRFRENVKGVYNNPDMVMELERQKEQNKHLQMISMLKKENEKLSAHNQWVGHSIKTPKRMRFFLLIKNKF